MSPTRALRSIGNILGLSWWAKVETIDPNITYWFGPFLTRRGLKRNLVTFENDLYQEGVESLHHSFIRGRRLEPLTS